ncbi:MAG TPA: response regulator transcription factor [Pyrinomonadaceae bacterium]|jgi:RNA polymerase sigma factor (sigma-70 family)
MNEETPIIYVVDDDESVRESLDSLIRSIGMRAAVFASATEFLKAKRFDAPGCLILDVRLPGLSGLDLQGELNREGVSVPIIFVTGHGDIPMTVRAMKAGAVEFLTKPFREQDLLDAIGQAVKRDRERRKTNNELNELRTHFAQLTPREKEVMELVAAGMLNKQIAYKLGTSEVTIKVHRSQVMQKMKADSVADLVRMSERLGIFATKV